MSTKLEFIQKKNTNCSICSARQKTSFPEQAIFYYIKKLFPTALNKYKDCFSDGMEFDVYIPELKVAIEYDGAQWHKTEAEHKREIKKYQFCKNHEIYLIRVKEQTEQSWDDTADKTYNIPVINNRKFHKLEQIIQNLLEELYGQKQSHFEINIEKDKNEILQYLSKVDNSLAEIRPDVATKWNYARNGNLTPEMFSVSSGEVVWWKCPDCGNEWKAHINDVIRNTYGCPECSKKQRGKTFRILCIKRKGSLADKNPELTKEWHPTKNGDLTPYDITIGCDKKVWWKCSKCGHVWKATIKDRGLDCCGCPVCSNKICVSGKNDLATTHPELAQEWHPTKNGELKSTDIVAGSHKKVWWKCSKCGHVWQTTVKSKGGCPVCIKKQRGESYISYCIKKKGSLAEKMPELIKEWHPIKNNTLTPYNITAGSNKKVWWKCSKCGHEWETVAANRGVRHCGCPECAKIQQGKTFTKLRAKERGSLAENMPELAKEWHPTKNGDLTPYDVTASSHKKVYWKCPKCGEKWQAVIRERAKGFCKYPHCKKSSNAH